MSVKVAVRVRPFNEREIKMLSAKCCIKMEGQRTIIKDYCIGTERTFTFDYSFWSHDGYKTDDGTMIPSDILSPYIDQEYVFKQLGQQVLDNAWQGYNCCLFAYGQTGSGKSYSMVGL